MCGRRAQVRKNVWRDCVRRAGVGETTLCEDDVHAAPVEEFLRVGSGGGGSSGNGVCAGLVVKAYLIPLVDYSRDGAIAFAADVHAQPSGRDKTDCPYSLACPFST